MDMLQLGVDCVLTSMLLMNTANDHDVIMVL
jgi:hypothetical protein